MRLRIDVEKSIERNRLIPTSWFNKIKDYFTYSFFAIIIIIGIIGPTKGVAIRIHTPDMILIFVLLLVSIVINYSLYKMDRLTVFDNHKSKLDRSFFITLANENKWSLIKETENALFLNATTRFRHERQVTIIINNNLIFINVMSFGLRDVKSPLYMGSDREILNQILNKIKNNAT
jgi:hypothetical protein